jgi:hypothetical protein
MGNPVNDAEPFDLTWDGIPGVDDDFSEIEIEMANEKVGVNVEPLDLRWDGIPGVDDDFSEIDIEDATLYEKIHTVSFWLNQLRTDFKYRWTINGDQYYVGNIEWTDFCRKHEKMVTLYGRYRNDDKYMKELSRLFKGVPGLTGIIPDIDLCVYADGARSGGRSPEDLKSIFHDLSNDRDFLHELEIYGDVRESDSGDGPLIEMLFFDRKDGPAVQFRNGDQLWFSNGRPHRMDGPAYDCGIYKKYFQFGLLHRLDGPAIERDGNCEWYIHGKQFDMRKTIEDYKLPADWTVWTEEEKMMVRDVMETADELYSGIEDPEKSTRLV